MSALQITYIVILAVCVAASGFFSGSETALVGIQRERVHQLAQTGKRGERVEELLSNPDRMLGTLLVANNFVNILAASIATALAINLVGESWGPWLATAALTAVILIFGEIGPKTMAARYPEQFALFVAPGVYRAAKILNPISRVFVGITRWLFRLLRLRFDAGPSPVTEEDIRTMALLGERAGEIEPTERAIIDALFRVGDRPIREAMTPRVDIRSLGSPVTVDDVRRLVAETGHSRFPVSGDSLDELEGILAVKDLLRMPADPDDAQVRRVLREPYYIPESKPILEVLQEMKLNRLGFVVVVDEHGGIEGIVTPKDIIGEVMGELADEYDPGAPSIVAAGPGRWLIDGRAGIDELEEAIGRQLPRGAYGTAGGLVLDLAGRIPEEGDWVENEGVRLTVVRMDRKRIARIRVETAG